MTVRVSNMSENEAQSRKYWYYTLVGVSPLAVSNSIVWFFRKHPSIEVEEIRFITSQPDPLNGKGGTKELLDEIVTTLEEDFKAIMGQELVKRGTAVNHDEVIEIPEADLPEAITILARAVKEVPSDRGFIFDITAGRKAMGNALLCVGLLAYAKWKRDVKLHYYLLKKFTRDMMKKRATELSRDDVESLLFDVKDIDSAFSRL